MELRVPAMSMIRIAVGVLLIGAVGIPAASAAVTECTFDEGTATVTITAVDDITVEAAIDAGGEILVSTSESGVAVCDGATVSNTDRIDIHAGDSNGVRITGTPSFSPGLTSEGAGTSEIEFRVLDGIAAPVLITGTPAADAFSTAYVQIDGSDGVGVNVNGDGDADVLFPIASATGLILATEGGDDTTDLTGGTAPPAGTALSVGGGPGSDVMRFRGSLDDVSLFGAAGRDVLDLSSVDAAASLFVDLDSTSGGFAPAYGNPFTVTGFEELIGHGGEDVLGGTDGRQRVFGRGGEDVLLGLGGDDYLDGGGGADWMRGGTGTDTCLGTMIDRVRSCER
jgi:hypothetical protein